MKRLWLFSVILISLLFLGWYWLLPRAHPLHLKSGHHLVGLIDTTRARQLKTAPQLLPYLSLLSQPEQRVANQQKISNLLKSDAQVEFGLGAPLSELELLTETSEIIAAPATRSLPSTAMLVWQNTPQAYLLIHATPGKNLLQPVPARRWFGSVLNKNISEAPSVILAVGETENAVIVTLVLEFDSAAQAVAALNELAKPSPNESFAFILQPGAKQITQQSKLVVVRFDLPSSWVLQAIRSR